jgi:hypothetical protein
VLVQRLYLQLNYNKKPRPRAVRPIGDDATAPTPVPPSLVLLLALALVLSDAETAAVALAPLPALGRCEPGEADTTRPPRLLGGEWRGGRRGTGARCSVGTPAVMLALPGPSTPYAGPCTVVVTVALLASESRLHSTPRSLAGSSYAPMTAPSPRKYAVAATLLRQEEATCLLFCASLRLEPK